MVNLSEVVFANIRLPEKLWKKFENKCYYYELTHSEVMVLCLEKFVKGDYDDELQLPKD